MSPVLFNNVTRRVFRSLKEKWAREGIGTMVCSSVAWQTTHAMFADDTTLFASCKADLIRMIKDVRAALAEHGLNLNVDKCLVQSSCPDVLLQPIEIDGQRIPMVSATAGFKVLGTQFSLQGRCAAEVKSRMSAAWGKFHSLWPLLGKRDGNLSKRLRIFDSSVTQTAFWCSESWLLTRKEKQLLQTTQNSMLRRIAGPRRRPDEGYVDWIRRSTRKAIARAKEAGIRFWQAAHLKSKWSWAGHVLRMNPERIARRAVEWRDSRWQATEYLVPISMRITRPVSKRWFRWEDELHKYAAHCGWDSWQAVAQQRDDSGSASVWLNHCEAFVLFAKR